MWGNPLHNHGKACGPPDREHLNASTSRKATMVPWCGASSTSRVAGQTHMTPSSHYTTCTSLSARHVPLAHYAVREATTSGPLLRVSVATVAFKFHCPTSLAFNTWNQKPICRLKVVALPYMPFLVDKSGSSSRISRRDKPRITKRFDPLIMHLLRKGWLSCSQMMVRCLATG